MCSIFGVMEIRHDHAAIRKMVELYFPPNSAMVTGYGFDMLYAGPREAVVERMLSLPAVSRLRGA